MKSLTPNPVESDPSYLIQLLEIESIYNSAPVGLCIFDKDLRYIRLNQCVADMNGVSIKDHIGRTPSEVVPDLSAQAENVLKEILRTGETIQAEIVGETPAHPGVTRYYDSTWLPVKDPSGDIIGISVVAVDATAKKKALEHLQKSNERKNKFISLLSHELRNPLAAITMALNLLEHSLTLDELSKQTFEVIERQAKQLSRLVDDLLDVTRINKNYIELKKECFDINELIRHTINDYQKFYSNRGVSLDFKSSAESLPINADPARIAQIFGNLLHNAAKFSDEGDQVTVTAEIDSVRSEAVVIVSDTGHGMAADILPDIFDPFVQADESLAREKGGIGLGLAIVKGMIELHEGSITVSSEGMDMGSEFTVRLPLSTCIPEEKFELQEITEEKKCLPLKILIIEDNPDLLDIVCELLDVLGHETAAAGDGTAGIEKAREFKPDVILCDIGLPGISGYEVAERISNDRELSDIFLIALSGYAQPRDIERARNSGFKRHLSKPVRLDVLKKALAEAANR
jgi:PAS domain S-box-containing protein